MYSDCLAVSEIVFRKINSGVWFVQTFYGKYLTEIVLRKIISGVWFVDNFTENMKCVTGGWVGPVR